VTPTRQELETLEEMNATNMTESTIEHVGMDVQVAETQEGIQRQAVAQVMGTTCAPGQREGTKK